MGATCCRSDIKYSKDNEQTLTQSQSKDMRPRRKESLVFEQQLPSKQNILTPPAEMLLDVSEGIEFQPSDVESQKRSSVQYKYDYDDGHTPAFRTAQFMDTQKSGTNKEEKLSIQRNSINFIQEVSEINSRPLLTNSIKESGTLQLGTIGNSPVKQFVQTNSLSKTAQFVKSRTISADQPPKAFEQVNFSPTPTPEIRPKEKSIPKFVRQVSQLQEPVKLSQQTHVNTVNNDEEKSVRSVNTHKSILKKSTQKVSQFKRGKTFGDKAGDNNSSYQSRRVRFDPEVEKSQKLKRSQSRFK